MGTIFVVSVETSASSGIDHEAVAAIEDAFAEIARVEAAISSWQTDSDTTRLNESVGSWVTIGPDLLAVLARSIELGEMTRGGFDVTYASCTQSPDDILEADWMRSCLPAVSFENIDLDPDTSMARLADGTQIGLGAVGKGYAVDRAADVLRSAGFADFVVDGGGDILTSGRQGNQPWRVGVQDPRGEPGDLMGVLSLPATGAAVATSGDYESFSDEDGERVHHIIDPRTGQPASGLISVTVIAQDAATADALATGLFVLGPNQAMEVVEGLNGVEAILIDADRASLLSSGVAPLLESP